MCRMNTCPRCGCEMDDMQNACPGCLAEPPFTRPHGSARLSGNTLASILVRHNIIDPCAVEDAEGYDGGMTMLRVRTAAQEITETIAPSDKLSGLTWKRHCQRKLSGN